MSKSSNIPQHIKDIFALIEDYQDKGIPIPSDAVEGYTISIEPDGTTLIIKQWPTNEVS